MPKKTSRLWCMNLLRACLPWCVLAGILAGAPNWIPAKDSPRHPPSREARLADPRQRTRQAELLHKDSDERRRAALLKARRQGWPTRGISPRGEEYELIALSTTGMPVYRRTVTTNATISINAHQLHSPPFGLKGDGMILGIWDIGGARETHQEFNQTGSPRAFVKDGAAVAAHSTSVTGVAIAGGVNVEALGSAPRASAWNFDWNDDLAEMVASAAADPVSSNTLQVSNHSYGTYHGWAYTNLSGSTGWHWTGDYYKPDGTGYREDLNFGRYADDTAQLDRIVYEAPYYLPIRAAGNDRGEGFLGPGTFYYYDSILEDWQSTTYDSATAPYPDYFKGGYDTIIFDAAGKNSLTVGAVRDAVTSGARDPSKAAMTTFSGWGPTDDGRIKPDVVANGHTVRTVSFTGDGNYGSGSGTSFAAPGVAAVALLLVQYSAEHLPGWRMRAETLKALLIHGATDIGRPGPDYVNGWGLVDAIASIQVLQDQFTTPTAWAWPLVEGRLDDTRTTDTFFVHWSGMTPLVATLCWTDPPTSPAGTLLNDRTPRLVNDLDLRLEGPGGVYYPFVLDPDAPEANAITGDNRVDNVEQVRIASAPTSGTHRITVSHKDYLFNGSQSYTLLVSGQTPPLEPHPLSVAAIEPSSAVAGQTLDFRIEGGVFLVGTRFSLERNHVHIEATGEITSPWELTGGIDLAEAEEGFYTLRICRPDGIELRIENAFEVRNPSRVIEWKAAGAPEGR